VSPARLTSVGYGGRAALIQPLYRQPGSLSRRALLVDTNFVERVMSGGCATACDEVIDDGNDRQHQKYVYDAACDVKSEKSAQPQKQQNYSDNSKHKFSS
jgi:hypothetical protein